MSTNHVTALPELPTKVGKLTRLAPPRYKRLYGMALDGCFPVERRNGRLFVLDDDLPLVVAALGLTVSV